jgi:hypothetical protein
VAAAVLLLLFAVPLEAQTGALIQTANQGRINWLTGELQAVGEAKARAQLWDEQVKQDVMRRQALMDGRRHLYDALKSVRINSSLTVGDRVAGDAVLREELKGRVNNSVVLDRTVVPGERMRLRVGMKLWGSLSKTLIPDSVWYEKPSEVSDKELDQDGMGLRGQIETHTGLIVDARGLDVEPALVCRIYGPEKRLLYGPGVVRPSVAIGRGMAGYMKDRRGAVRSSRSGRNPLILRAEEKAAPKGCEVTVSAEGSEALLPRPKDLGFLRRGQVIILVGSGMGDEPTEYHLGQ